MPNFNFLRVSVWNAQRHGEFSNYGTCGVLKAGLG